jgi:cell shape-determining protein MreC
MDWELYERQRATLMFIGVAFLCFLLLAFQRSAAVQHVKAFIVACTSPTQRVFTHFTRPAPAGETSPAAPLMSSGPVETAPVAEAPVDVDLHPENSRTLRVLADENARLRDILELKRSHWPKLVAAHVVNRDPQRWFQEILIDKGSGEGLKVDDPVVAMSGNREALVGRIAEAGAHTSRVMLVQDSLSAVAASVSGAAGEDGVVEGNNGHDLYLKYLNRESKARIGDLVVTSGLGKTFPEGIAIGYIREIDLDQRQLFLQARLTPATLGSPMRVVGVLLRSD